MGNRELMIDPDGGRTTSTFDALNRVSALMASNGTVYTSLYDQGGNLTTLLYGSDSEITTYDALGRPATMTQLHASKVISTVVDTYDAAGRKTKQVANGVTTSYTYDNASRLTGQQTSGAFSTFTYDAVGNQTVKHHQGSLPATMTYDAAQRLTTMQDGPTRVTFTYDNNGNTTDERRGSAAIRTVYAYNRRNEMTKVTLPDETSTTMTYDGDGMRRTKQTASGTTTYVWDGSDYLGEIS